MRKATVALAKVTGQMEAILPEAGESSCDQGLLCHSRQDPAYVRVRTASRGEKRYPSTTLLSPRIQMEHLPLCTFPERRPFITEAMTGELKQPSLSENGLHRAVPCHTKLASLIRRDEALTQWLMV
eukprot:superscaffoldBa00000202_g2667